MMNWYLRTLFVLATYLLTTPSIHAEESPYSINLFGFSWHEDRSQRADAHQVNPGIGLRYDLSESWYVEGNMIWKNSVKGKTATIGLGYHTEVTKVQGRPLKIGLQVMRMHYEFPTKQSQSGYVPAVTTEYVVTKKFTVAVNFFIKPKESVVFGGFNYRF